MNFTKKTFLLFFAVLILGIIFPLNFASAAWYEWLADKIIGGLSGWFLFGFLIIAFILSSITSLFPIITGGLLQWVFGLNIPLTRCPGPPAPPCVVDIGWAFTRDLANIFFILFLVIIAFATILGIESYGMRRLLPILITMALLINFSQLLVGVIVDFFNVLTNFFISKLGSVNLFWQITAQNANNFLNHFTNFQFLNLWDNLALLFKMAIMILFNLILGFMLLIYFLLFFLRIPMLWMLTIMAPISFVCAIIPFTKNKFSEWMKNVIEWSMIGFWGGLYLYLGLYVLTEAQTTFNTGAYAMSYQLAAGIQTTIQELLPFIVAIVFLALGAMTAFSTNALFSGALVAAGASVYKNYLSPDKWGRATYKWGMQKAKDFKPGAAAATAVGGARSLLRAETWKQAPGKIWKGAKDRAEKYRDYIRYGGPDGVRFNEKKKEKTGKLEKDLKDLRDKKITIENRDEVDRRKTAEWRRIDTQIKEKERERDKVKGSPQEKEYEKEIKGLNIERNNAYAKVEKEVESERQSIGKEITSKEKELEEVSDKKFRDVVKEKLEKGDITDVSTALGRMFDRVGPLGETELGKAFYEFGDKDMALAVAVGELKNFSGEVLADKFASGAVNGMEKVATMKLLAQEKDMDKLFEKMARKYNVPEKELATDPRFKKEIKETIELAEKADARSDIGRGDSRLARAFAGTKGYEGLNEEEAVRKFIDEKMRQSDISKMSKETFEDSAVAQSFAETKGELGYYRTISRELSAAVEPMMDSLKQVFEKTYGKDDSEENRKAFKETYHGFSYLMEKNKDAMKGMGYYYPWEPKPTKKPSGLAAEVGLEEEEEREGEKGPGPRPRGRTR